MVLMIALIIWFSLSGLASAESNITAFAFITEPQVILSGVSSETITIEARDSAGNPVKGNTVCLEFTSASITGGFSTNESWNESFKTLVLTLGTNQYRRNLFYKDSSVGTHAISFRGLLRPEGKTCPALSPEEWTAQWTAIQQITISSQSEQNLSDEVVTSETPPATNPPLSPKSFDYPSIKADAGSDRTAVAGELVEFKGNAVGLDDKPLDSARFWWNFGDGYTFEGRSVLHTFRIPGTYTVGLHVSSGEYAFSDYINVSVVPNQLQFSGVITGEDGYIRLVNKGKNEIDIGGWILEDSTGKTFTIPVKTKIAPQAEIALLNSVTSLFASFPSPAIIRYPNNREAVRWGGPAPSVSLPAGKADAKTPVAEIKESDPVQNELATPLYSSAGESSMLFFWFAVGFSVLASVAFFLFRKFYT